MRWRWIERRPIRRPRRRLAIEPLEERRVLADLGIGVTLLNVAENPGDTEINVGKVGALFSLEVKVQDRRDPAAGVIALPIHVSWDPVFLELNGNQVGPDFDSGPVILTPEFPLQRELDAFVPAAPVCTPADFPECANLQGLRAASLPALPDPDPGMPIGDMGEETFAAIALKARRVTEALEDARFTIRLAGSMSFADAEVLEAVLPGSNATGVDELTVQTLIKVDPVMISGTKFHDLDGNGMRDAGETGLPGWTIRLIRDENINSMPDPGEPEVTAVTAADGTYQLPIEVDGTYLVREVPQAGWFQTTPNPPPIIPSGMDLTGIDFGNRMQGNSLSGAVFADTNLNGVFESGEDGLPNVTIQLRRTDDEIADVLTAVTGPDGWYHFEDLPLGIFEITELQPAGFVNASIAPGSVFLPGQTLPCTACQGATNGLNQFASVDLSENGDGVDYNFGENVIPTKRRFLASVDSFRENCILLGVNCVTVPGTPEDDVITFEPDTDVVRVMVNVGPVQEFFRSDVDIVKVDGGAGDDSVTLIGSGAVDVAHLTADACTLQTGNFQMGDYAVLAVNAEQTTADGRMGIDQAVFRDSIGNDVLQGSFIGPIQNLEVALNAARTVNAIDFELLRAVSVPHPGVADTDTADPNGVPVNLVGKWVLV